MKPLIKTGRLFYGIGIVAYGVQQLIIKDFRPEILSPFPAWAHQHIFFPILTGLAIIVAGIIISGVFTFKKVNTKAVCLYLGLYFFTLIVLSHLPYILIFSPNKAFHLGVWAEVLKCLAYCGGAFVMAGSFTNNNSTGSTKPVSGSWLQKLIPFGRIFFSTTMIVYGCCHFVYIDYIYHMVPKWFGIPVFWTYFGGIALIASGLAIVFKIWIKPVGLLLAVMLFLWFIFLHVPDAIANPSLNNGNEVVSAFDALLFCGTALVIALTNRSKKLAE
jgi:uncharacterized membrane protein YphA (DoxX/SURF4 family)